MRNVEMVGLGFSADELVGVTALSDAILKPTQDRQQVINNAIDNYKPLNSDRTFNTQNIAMLYKMILHVETNMLVQQETETITIKDLKTELQKKLHEMQLHEMQYGKLDLMVSPKGKEMSAQRDKIQAQINKAMLPSFKRKTRLYYGLLQYWMSLGYSKEEIEGILNEIYTRGALSVNHTNMLHHVRYTKEAFDKSYPHLHTTYHLVPAVITFIIGTALFATSLATGDFADYRVILGAMSVGGFIWSLYANKTTGKAEFEEEFQQSLINSLAAKSLSPALHASRRASRERTDIFVKENLPIILLFAAFTALLLVDMWILGGALSVMGKELIIEFPVKGGWNTFLLLIVPMAIRHALVKLPSYVSNPKAFRALTNLASLLKGPLIFYGLGFTLGMFFTTSYVPIIGAILAGFSAILCGYLLYVKFVKKDNNNYDIPELGNISVNKLIMYSAGATVLLGALAVAGLMALSNPFTFSVGLIVIAALYFGGLNKIMDSYAAKKDVPRQYNAESKELKELTEISSPKNESNKGYYPSNIFETQNVASRNSPAPKPY